MSPDDRQRCARVRAARAYANLKQPELAKASGVGYATIKRIENEQRAPMLEELRAIADACKVPRAFLEAGFGADGAHETELRTRMQNAETQLAAMWKTISNVEGELGATRSQVEALTREALARRERQAAERERQRRGTKRASPRAEDAQ